MSIFAFCAFLPREFERNRTLSKKTIYRLRKSLGWCIIKLKIRLRIFLYTPVLCLWSSDDCNDNEQFNQRKTSAATDTFLFHENLLFQLTRLCFALNTFVHQTRNLLRSRRFRREHNENFPYCNTNRSSETVQPEQCRHSIPVPVSAGNVSSLSRHSYSLSAKRRLQFTISG